MTRPSRIVTQAAFLAFAALVVCLFVPWQGAARQGPTRARRDRTVLQAPPGPCRGDAQRHPGTHSAKQEPRTASRVDSPLARLFAIRSLAALGTADAFEAIEGSLARDPSPSVRVAAAAALSTRRDSCLALIRAWEHESDPSVLEALAEALGRHGDESCARALLTSLSDTQRQPLWPASAAWLWSAPIHLAEAMEDRAVRLRAAGHAEVADLIDRAVRRVQGIEPPPCEGTTGTPVAR